MASVDSGDGASPAEHSREQLSSKLTITSHEETNISGNNSYGSASPVHSDTSTLLYGHEPFDQFSVRVKELCHSLWGNPDRSLIGRLYRSQLGGILHARSILGSFWTSSSNEFAIERLTGGGFNRIIGITITSKKSSVPRQLILRVPRFEEASPEREVATLRFIRQNTSIPVADVEAADFTINNPLKKPYVIQKRIPGNDLQATIQDLSQEQLCIVAKELGRVLIALQSVKSPHPGVIEETFDRHEGRKFSVRAFELKTPFGIVQEPEELRQAIDSTEKQSIINFFLAQLQRWKAVDTPYGEHKVHLWNLLITAARQMDQAGFFDDNDYWLCHLDFHARNIMVEAKTQGTLSISGILDWDTAVFAPKFVSCTPPWWIWADEDNEEDEEDESKANELPRSETGQELKRCFEETVGQEFLRYAYEPQYRLARILFQLAIHGIRSNEYFRLAETILVEWTTLYDSLVPEQEPAIQE